MAAAQDREVVRELIDLVFRLTKGWLRSPMAENPEIESCGRPIANSLMFGRLMPYSEFVRPLVTTGSASIRLESSRTWLKTFDPAVAVWDSM